MKNETFNGRVDLRFSTSESEMLNRYFARRPISNKTDFFKEHFWRSFLLTDEVGLEENIGTIKAVSLDTLEIVKHTQFLLAALAEDLSTEFSPEKQQRIQEVITNLPILKE